MEVMGTGGEGGEGEGIEKGPKQGLIKGLMRAYLGSLPFPSLPPSPHEKVKAKSCSPDLKRLGGHVLAGLRLTSRMDGPTSWPWLK